MGYRDVTPNLHGRCYIAVRFVQSTWRHSECSELLNQLQQISCRWILLGLRWFQWGVVWLVSKALCDNSAVLCRARGRQGVPCGDTALSVPWQRREQRGQAGPGQTQYTGKVTAFCGKIRWFVLEAILEKRNSFLLLRERPITNFDRDTFTF